MISKYIMCNSFRDDKCGEGVALYVKLFLKVLTNKAVSCCCQYVVGMVNSRNCLSW